jgi:hypothetical protein
MNPETLQQQITGDSKKRNELVNKLNTKINELQNNRYSVSPQKMKQINKQIKKEKKLNDNDPRVTPIMNDYYVNALKSLPGYELPDPHTILEKKEEYTLKYYNFCITLLKNNNNNQEVLKNPYCTYMREVLGLIL